MNNPKHLPESYHPRRPVILDLAGAKVMYDTQNLEIKNI